MPKNLRLNSNIDKNIKNKDRGKNILIPSLKITNFKIKFKNLNVSLIGEIEDFPFLSL